MKNNMESILIYSKSFKTKNGETFAKLRASVQGFVFDIQLSRLADAKLTVEKLNWPVELILDDGDYFVKNKTYTTASGESKTKEVIVVRDFQEAKQGEFVKKTLSDLVAEQADRD